MRLKLFEEFRSPYSFLNEKVTKSVNQDKVVARIKKLAKSVMENTQAISDIMKAAGDAAAPYETEVKGQLKQMMEYFEQVDILSVAVGNIVASLNTNQKTEARPAYAQVVEELVSLHPKLQTQVQELKAKYTVPKPKPNTVEVKDVNTGRKSMFEEPKVQFDARIAAEQSKKHIRENVFTDFVDNIVSAYTKLVKKISGFVKQNEPHVTKLTALADQLNAQDSESDT